MDSISQVFSLPNTFSSLHSLLFSSFSYTVALSVVEALDYSFHILSTMSSLRSRVKGQAQKLKKTKSVGDFLHTIFDKSPTSKRFDAGRSPPLLYQDFDNLTSSKLCPILSSAFQADLTKFAESEQDNCRTLRKTKSFCGSIRGLFKVRYNDSQADQAPEIDLSMPEALTSPYPKIAPAIWIQSTNEREVVLQRQSKDYIEPRSPSRTMARGFQSITSDRPYPTEVAMNNHPSSPGPEFALELGRDDIDADFRSRAGDMDRRHIALSTLFGRGPDSEESLLEGTGPVLGHSSSYQDADEHSWDSSSSERLGLVLLSSRLPDGKIVSLRVYLADVAKFSSEQI